VRAGVLVHRVLPETGWHRGVSRRRQRTGTEVGAERGERRPVLERDLGDRVVDIIIQCFSERLPDVVGQAHAGSVGRYRGGGFALHGALRVHAAFGLGEQRLELWAYDRVLERRRSELLRWRCRLVGSRR
jgi:hypothetical protein